MLLQFFILYELRSYNSAALLQQEFAAQRLRFVVAEGEAQPRLRICSERYFAEQMKLTNISLDANFLQNARYCLEAEPVRRQAWNSHLRSLVVLPGEYSASGAERIFVVDFFDVHYLVNYFAHIRTLISSALRPELAGKLFWLTGARGAERVPLPLQYPLGLLHDWLGSRDKPVERLEIEFGARVPQNLVQFAHKLKGGKDQLLYKENLKFSNFCAVKKYENFQLIKPDVWKIVSEAFHALDVQKRDFDAVYLSARAHNQNLGVTVTHEFIFDQLLRPLQNNLTPESIPIRVFFRSSLLEQGLLAPYQLASLGKNQQPNLRDYLLQQFPGLFDAEGELKPTVKHLRVLQMGVPLPLSTQLIFLHRKFSYPDGWIYLLLDF